MDKPAPHQDVVRGHRAAPKERRGAMRGLPAGQKARARPELLVMPALVMPEPLAMQQTTATPSTPAPALPPRTPTAQSARSPRVSFPLHGTRLLA